VAHSLTKYISNQALGQSFIKCLIKDRVLAWKIKILLGAEKTSLLRESIPLKLVHNYSHGLDSIPFVICGYSQNNLN